MHIGLWTREKSNCLRINLLVVQNWTKIRLTDIAKTQKSGRHFVTKGTLLASSIANQRRQFVIERLWIYTNLRWIVSSAALWRCKQNDGRFLMSLKCLLGAFKWPWLKSFYNITKAKRALWLANSASTICPWVYAADVLKN